eukprot:SAG31_NODE_16730_length_698_cov_1.040067_2_plen_85_part_01
MMQVRKRDGGDAHAVGTIDRESRNKSCKAPATNKHRVKPSKLHAFSLFLTRSLPPQVRKRDDGEIYAVKIMRKAHVVAMNDVEGV